MPSFKNIEKTHKFIKSKGVTKEDVEHAIKRAKR